MIHGCVPGYRQSEEQGGFLESYDNYNGDGLDAAADRAAYTFSFPANFGAGWNSYCGSLATAVLLLVLLLLGIPTPGRTGRVEGLPLADSLAYTGTVLPEYPGMNKPEY
eukprot:425412-Rhodomonas_salina.1